MVSMGHEYSKSQMVGLSIGFMVLPIVFFGLRIWARSLAKRFTLDDYFAGAALLFSICCCCLQLSAAMFGHLGQHQPQHPDGTTILDDPGLAFFEESKFAMNLLALIGLGLVKTSILVLYLSLFPNRKFRLIVYGALVYVAVWTVSFFFAHLFTCWPVTAFIDFYQNKSCINQPAMYLAVLYTDVIADLFILVLPLPLVIGLQMVLRTKLVVIAMLVLGGPVCAISITRVVATYSIIEEYVKYPHDIIYYTAPVFFWTNIELSMAIVCACLSTLKPLWKRFFAKPSNTDPNSYKLDYASAKATKDRAINSIPYEELDDIELLRHNGPGLGPHNAKDIVMVTTISQTTEQTDKYGATMLQKAGVRPVGHWQEQ